MSALVAVRAAWPVVPGKVYVAVSGGLDSMTLLEACARVRREDDPQRELVVVHVNHGLRGKESRGDESFVRGEARRLGLAFRSCRLEWQGENPSQATCRRKRNLFFRSLLSPGDRLFLAHHRDDQAETLLLRLIRGSGLKGLRAMAPVNGPWVRPFLALSRREIASQAAAWGVRWREDSSNASLKYERNWVRHSLLPLLESRRPGVSSRLAGLAEEVREGWRAPEAAQGFDSGQGWKLFRREELTAGGTALLSSQFSLSRSHAEGLLRLLKKGFGKYTAPGLHFHCSCGQVLVGRPDFPAPRWDESSGRWISALGEWRLRSVPGAPVGDRAKKSAQRLKVPVFFRDQLPWAESPGKGSFLLPGEGEGASASAAAEFWLTPSAAPYAPARGTSTKSRHPQS